MLFDRESSADTAARIVDTVYRTVIESDAWQDLIDQLSALVPGGQGALFYHDAATAYGAIALTSGFDRKFSELYDEYYNRINPWMPGATARPIGLGVRAEQMLPRSDLSKTEFFSDWLAPQKLSTGIGLTVARSNGRVFLVSVVGPNGGDDRWNSGAGTLTAVSPHFGRAVNIYKRASINSAAMEAASGLIGAADCVLLAVGEGRKLVWLNDAARNLLERDDILRLSLNGTVGLRHDDADSLMGAMLRDRPGLADAPRSRTFGVRARRGELLRLGVTNVSRSRLELALRGPLVFITLFAGKVSALELAEHIRHQYGLTKREAEVAKAVSKGQSIDEIAQGVHLGRETVRVHLKAIYAKMGVSSQSAVAARFLGLATRDPSE